MIRRLPAPWGSLIDREQTVSFRFEGRQYQGLKGDTLASALAANGVLMISRSFKYHRPRGAFGFAGMDANSYVQVGDQPNVLADQLPISEGLEASAQNVLGSLDKDRGSAVGRFSRFLPPGFYYRAFFRPRGVWKYWEILFRRAAGLGRINTASVHGHFDKQYLFADVAVIGAGPAGLKAAISAARAGAKVVIADDGAQAGGSLNYARFGREAEEVASLRDDLLKQVEAEKNIRLLENTTCTGWYADNWLAMHGGKRLFKLRAGQVVVATGSVEQPMVFGNNDLPGVIPASACQRLMRMYGVMPGEKIVIATSNSEGYDVALDLCEAGAPPVLLVDLNSSTTDPDAATRLTGFGVEVLSGHTVSEAIPGPGNRSITAARIDKLDPGGKPAGHSKKIPADCLVTAIGYSPLGQLPCQAGAGMVYKDDVHSLAISGLPENAHSAGSVEHAYQLAAVLEQGAHAGSAAAARAGFGPGPQQGPPTDPGAGSVNHPWPVFPHPGRKDFVDFDEDQTVSDLEQAVLDGFDHPELAKRYTTTGMGPSQGRLSALNALRIVRHFNGDSSNDFEVTTQRPPFKPLSLGLLAGRNFQPERLTPMHQWHLEHGARMMPAGLWQRPAYYGEKGTRENAIAREVKAVRTGAGLIDVSTLGGIEVRGPDAAGFINRCYTFAYMKQAVGTTRYLLMCDDSGAVVDDGVAYRIAEDHFYLTTTTTGSDGVYRAMLRHIAEWGMQVSIANVTTAWAAMSLAGPDSRRIMQKLDTDLDFDRNAFPYLAGRSGLIRQQPAMALRVGFVGELGFELHVPWHAAQSTWRAVLEAGQEFEIRPVGVEAQRILRLEKGHLIIGQDTDGLTHPAEAGLGWAVRKDRSGFVGGPAIGFMEENGVERQLTGFHLENDKDPIPEECNLVLDGDAISGRVTSVTRSDSLGRVIGLAYVAPGQATPGSKFNIKLSNGQMALACSVELPFYDPDKQRQAM